MKVRQYFLHVIMYELMENFYLNLVQSSVLEYLVRFHCILLWHCKIITAMIKLNWSVSFLSNIDFTPVVD
jgi:hypothetical protein